jgi:hypothetical protein
MTLSPHTYFKCIAALGLAFGMNLSQAQLPGIGGVHLKDRIVRVEVRELVLYVDLTEATVAIELENMTGKVLSMAAASLMLGACQTHNSNFRGLTQLSHKKPADVLRFSIDDLRRVEPGEKFLVSIRTGTADLTCRTLAQAQGLDVSLDLWVFDGKEGVRVPVRVPTQVRVGK